MKNLLLLKKLFIGTLFCVFALNSCAQVCTIVDSMSISIGAPYAYGVAWDGSGLWISGNTTGKIFKYNLAGQKVDTIKDPAHNIGDATFGMVCVGTHLYTVCYTCDTMYEIDLATKQVINGYVGLTQDDRVNIGYDGANTLYFVNGNDGAGSYTFDIAAGTFTPWGTANAPYSNGLIYLNHHLYGTYHSFVPSQSHIKEFDTLTGAGSNIQNWCVNDPFGGLGMTYDGQFIWQATINGQKIYKVAFNPTGINEQSKENEDLLIYPNPSFGKVYISLNKTIQNGTIKIINALGENVYNEQMSNMDIARNYIELKLSEGMYFISLIDKEKIYTKILLVQ